MQWSVECMSDGLLSYIESSTCDEEPDDEVAGGVRPVDGPRIVEDRICAVCRERRAR
jgi:hypothetical protein